jgi:hypothetical protein
MEGFPRYCGRIYPPVVEGFTLLWWKEFWHRGRISRADVEETPPASWKNFPCDDQAGGATIRQKDDIKISFISICQSLCCIPDISPPSYGYRGRISPLTQIQGRRNGGKISPPVASLNASRAHFAAGRACSSDKAVPCLLRCPLRI